MDIKTEIERLKDEEKNIEDVKSLKNEEQKRSVTLNLWPILPILIIVVTVSWFSNDGNGANLWRYWWLIFLVKPLFFGWGKKWKTNSSCVSKPEFV